MERRKICWGGLFLIALLCLNYALLYQFYGDKIRNLSRFSNLSRSDNNMFSSIIWPNVTPPIARLPTTVSMAQAATLPKQQQKLAPCDRDGLTGPLRIDLEEFERVYWTELDGNPPTNGTETFLGNFSTVNAANHEAVYLGRRDCDPIQRIAVIIPFRDRESHLKILLGHLLPILKRQGVRYSIFVIEQVGRGVFNKGRVMNTGFQYATAAGNLNGEPFDCYVFQDVDLLMENDKLLYACSGGIHVDHLSTTINKFNYRPLCCGMTVGGVLAFSGQQYNRVNGFPNNFWGWGGEDDAMNQRIKSKGLRVKRPNYQIGRYTMIKHEREQLNPYNHKSGLAMKAAQASIDINGLKDLNTTVVRVELYQLFTRVYVDVGEL